MSTPVKNIAANLGSRAWGLVSMYLFTPIYTSILGVESYAIIYFYNVLFSVIAFADAGIASAMDREFAKSGSDAYKMGVLKVFERIYFSICTSVGIGFFFSSHFIATKWLNTTGIPETTLTGYIQLISIGISIQLMPNIYFGALMGSQKQVKAGVIQFLHQSIKTSGGVLVLLFIQKSLNLFFFWQIICNIVVIFFARGAIFGVLRNGNSIIKMSLSSVPKEIWRYLGGMFFIAILNALNVQADKILASKLFNLRDYGFYSLASTLGQLPYIVAVPIVLAVFPFMTRNFSENKKQEIYPVFRRISFLVSAILLPMCAIAVLYGEDLFGLWQRHLVLTPETSRAISVLIALLMIGNTFLGLQQMLFYLLLAKGRTKYTIIQVLFQVCLTIPLLFFFIEKFGLLGAGIPMIIVQGGGFIYLLFVVKKQFAEIQLLNYLIFVLFMPLIVTTCLSIFISRIGMVTGFRLFFVPATFGIVISSLVVNYICYNKFSGEKINFKKLF